MQKMSLPRNSSVLQTLKGFILLVYLGSSDGDLLYFKVLDMMQIIFLNI